MFLDYHSLTTVLIHIIPFMLLVEISDSGPGKKVGSSNPETFACLIVGSSGSVLHEESWFFLGLWEPSKTLYVLHS